MESKGIINIDQIKAYSQRFGARQTEECLRKLNFLQQFYNAYSLPLGRELLAEVNAEMVRLANKVLTDPESKEDDKAMYRAYTYIAQSWAKKINAYDEIVKNIVESK